ncbi:PAS domain-containing protein [Methylobacterium sp. J-059]|uniref:PAS domain-containing protein n=1 Tax=Methylobacterium sp. J-059 TaxID=2836643 RepID=UPI001FBA5740|nr:PAS domain-containing protein [Methylobacterium sp. J-059]MCJ2039040.1 PAS domain-containing protein [Methylobacterium sp. J-059]
MDRRFDSSVATSGGIGGSHERLHAALEASCVVGTWDLDHVRQVIVYDVGAAQLLTGDPDLAEKELTGPISIAAVHPADHAWLIDHVGEVTREGGLFLVEYRVLADDGAVRWLLSRGRTYLSEAGDPLRTCGILIDITEMHDGDDRYVVSGSGVSDDPLERAIDLALALKKTLGPDMPAGVRAATDLLLISLGQTLARIGRH